MSQAFTVKLSDVLYQQLQRTAAISNQSVDAVIEEGLSQILPPLLDEIPEEYQADVYPLLKMGADQLQAEATQVFPADQWTEYENLLNEKRARSLTAQEATRLRELRRLADLITLRRAYAVVLLKRQGYHSLTLTEHS
jgi:hypothetical protein